MPEHFHLLLSEPHEGSLSTVMQALKLGFAWRVLAAQRRAGTPESSRIWQARFYDFNVWSELKRIQKLRYMHRNPVKRELVEEPDQWPWSSFRSYAYGEAGPVRLNDASVLEMKVTGRALELLPDTA
jgi:putative transposase